MAQTFTHVGPYEDIPPSASPGLLFLKELLPSLDSLGPFDGPPSLVDYLTPDATFIMNGGPPIAAIAAFEMLPKRAQTLSRFYHSVYRAWDIVNPDGSGRRTVMYESTSLSVFKEDPEAVEVRVSEFNIVELIESKDVADGSVSLKATQLRSFLDGSPVTERAAMIRS